MSAALAGGALGRSLPVHSRGAPLVRQMMPRFCRSAARLASGASIGEHSWLRRAALRGRATHYMRGGIPAEERGEREGGYGEGLGGAAANAAVPPSVNCSAKNACGLPKNGGSCLAAVGVCFQVCRVPMRERECVFVGGLRHEAPHVDCAGFANCMRILPWATPICLHAPQGARVTLPGP